MPDKQLLQDQDSRKKGLRLTIIVVAHLLVVMTFFASSFIWSNFT